MRLAGGSEADGAFLVCRRLYGAGILSGARNHGNRDDLVAVPARLSVGGWGTASDSCRILDVRRKGSGVRQMTRTRRASRLRQHAGLKRLHEDHRFCAAAERNGKSASAAPARRAFQLLRCRKRSAGGIYAILFAGY